MIEKVDVIAKELGVELKAPKITADFVAGMIAKEEYFHFPESTHTVCVLTLYNGFRVSGESACASPENFNDEIGRRFAKENAVSHLWPFAGFWLRQKLWQEGAVGISEHEKQFWIDDPMESVNPALPHIDAVRDGHLEAPAAPGTVAFTRLQAPDNGGVVAGIAATAGVLADAGLLTQEERAKFTPEALLETRGGDNDPA